MGEHEELKVTIFYSCYCLDHHKKQIEVIKQNNDPQTTFYLLYTIASVSEKQHHKRHTMQFARRKTRQTKNCSNVDTFLCSTTYLYACSFSAVNAIQNGTLTIPFYLCIHILTTCFSETQQLSTAPQICLCGILLLRKGSCNG